MIHGRRTGSNSVTTTRDFYESSYHFDSDARQPQRGRLEKVLRFLDPVAGCSLLDLGSGVGWAAELAHEKGAGPPVVGADFAFTALRLGGRIAPHVQRIQADGGRLPFPASSFDRLISMGSLEHFPDVALGLREVVRVLKPGGRAVYRGAKLLRADGTAPRGGLVAVEMGETLHRRRPSCWLCRRHSGPPVYVTTGR